MDCPLEIPEGAQVLLDYGARKLDAGRIAILERHLSVCPACRGFCSAQNGLWEVLDSWQGAPVSPDFDRRLYRRIENEVSLWNLLVRPFRPLLFRRGLPVAAAVCLVVMAGALLERPASPPSAKPDVAQVESVQPEQLEQALDAMEMLNEFSHHVRSDGQKSKL